MTEIRTFGFQTVGTKKPEPNVRISVIWAFGPNCLKSERSDFSHSGFWSQLSEIRTFGFQSFGLLVPTVWNRNVFVWISDSLGFIKMSEIRTNLFGFQTEIQQTCVWNPNKFVPFGINLFGFETQICVWNPNKFVRISDRFDTEQKLEPNRRELSKIRTCSDFRLLLYLHIKACPVFRHLD